MKRLSMIEMKAPFDALQNNELVLDVRSPLEFAQGHVKGAKNIPVDRVMNHVDELKKYDAVFVYCAAGMRSQTACQILGTLGLTNLVCIDDGGYADWEDAGFPCASIHS
jgi:rhodanese-related sulfurtransferase